MSNTDPQAAALLRGAPQGSTSLRAVLSRHSVALSNILALVLLLVIGSILSPHFLSVPNIFNVLRGASMVGIVSIGMTFVILNRGIDLSVGSLTGLSSVLMAGMMPWGVAGWGVVPLVAAVALGVLNGLLITTCRLQPFIATLGMMIFARGLVYIYSDGSPIVASGVPAEVKALGSGYLGVVPVPVLVFLACAVIGHVVLRSTIFGREIYAVGANEEAARASGIRTKLNHIKVYAVSGLLAGISGIVLTARLGVGDPNAGQMYELDAIAACLIGGTTFDGGVGSVRGTVIGVLILAFLSNILNLLGISPYTQMLLKGLIIIVAVIVSEFRKR
ncbi:ABC transporter permease [Azospirillum canadense]|uniref:ABC transporter permease n=1 Tax=Azospirillum canadense TaxID=403962 RepID=UPI00222796BD|nr:ABC transporter permease [Azospirillum canadense]MCW2242360.1 ribose/xylose/arabinose/galactoside ABC-type transport system permease subunit [Azospirillum canadense]